MSTSAQGIPGSRALIDGRMALYCLLDNRQVVTFSLGVLLKSARTEGARLSVHIST